MAHHHSRPPPIRVYDMNLQPRPSVARTQDLSDLTPPPSPRTTTHREKKHHSRKRSSRVEYATERKPSRPTSLSRRTTPQTITKVGSGRQQREQEEDDRARDSGESFPQFCMSCEKQFLSTNNTFLYCSEACRVHDLTPPPFYTNSHSSHGNGTTYTSSNSPPRSPYARNFSAVEDGPDIIPRFSPTQSRPRSYFNSDPYPESYLAPSQAYSSSISHNNLCPENKSSTALESLRELATALPKTNGGRKGTRRSSGSEADSPPKHLPRNGSTVWNYIPFTTSGSKNATSTPSSSYSNSSTHAVSQSYSASNGYSGRSREDLYGYGKSHGTAVTGAYAVGGYGNSGGMGMGMDRPLPPRSGPGGYGHRPKSIDLVTPLGAGH